MLVKCINSEGIKWAVTKNKVYEVLKDNGSEYVIYIDNGSKRGIAKYRFIVCESDKGEVNMGKYEELATKIGQVVDTKNQQYGDAINNIDSILKILYPEGIKVEQYKDMSVMVRVLDKLFRLSKGNQGEESAWKDIAGYGILMSKDNK